MAIFSAFDGLYYADDNHFTEFLDGNEDVIFELIDALYAQELQFQEALFLDGNEDVIFELRDALHAEELQFQEALQASMISAQMTNAVSLSPPPMAVLAMPEPSLESSVVVNETGASSLSFCEICNERKENDQMFRHASCVYSFCLYCINKHVRAMIKDGKNIVMCPGSNCKCVLELEMCRPVLSKEVLDLWFQEALQASMISAQMTNDVSLSPPPLAVLAMPEPSLESSVVVNETGASSLSFCEICNERKENDQMFRHASCVYSFCLYCINKHVRAMIKDGKNIVMCPGSNCKCVLELEMCRPVLSKEVLDLWFQEALQASMISAQMTNDVSLSPPPLAVLAMPEPSLESSVVVNETGASSLSFCEICNERKENDQMFRHASCLYSFCLYCINKHVGAMINDGKNIVTCPGSNCKCVLELDMCRPVLSKEVLDLWDEALCKELVASLILYCPFKDCSAMMANNNEGNDVRESECPVCHRLFCVRCSVPWHSGVECEDYQRMNEDETGSEDLMESKLAKEKESESSLQCKIEGCPQTACSKELHMEMSSQKGSGEPFTAGTSNSPTSEGENVVEVSSPIVKPTSDSVADISLSSAQDDGKREVHARKPNIRLLALSCAAKRRNTMLRNTSNSKKLVCKRYAGPQASHESLRDKYIPKPGLPLERGHSITDFTPSKCPEDGQEKVEDYIEVNNDKSAAAAVFDDDVSDGLNETDDELLSDGFDSDASQKSHETRKNNRWFKEFFESLNNLTIEEINEPKSQWHCPACQDGPGAIRWYKGIQPLMTHCNTQGKKRMKLHQELAELLDEELRRRRTPVTPVTEVLAKWKALRGEEKDHQIFWPPMVVIMNTGHKQDVNHKWTGMGTQKLLDYFSSYSPVKAQHSYGPEGHRGMSILIFESSARGYLEAECLHVHFAKEGRGRSAWDHCPVYFLPDGERQLYGFMAVKEDLDIFNRHFKGKSKLKYELRSYQEMVMNQVNQMSEDNKQLIVLENRFAQEQSRADALQESLRIVSEKLRMRTEESGIVRQRTNLLHEKHKEEVDSLQQYFQDQLENILEARSEKDENLQPEQNENMEQSNTNEYRCREEKIAESMNLQEMKDFEAKKGKLMEVLVDKMVEIKKRHREEEEVMLETEFDAEPSCLVIEGTTGD